MASPVFFTSLRAGHDQSLLKKIQDLATAAGLEKVVKKNGLTAIKIHFGERGNTAFIRPLLVRPVVDAVLQAGGNPSSPIREPFMSEPEGTQSTISIRLS